VQDSISLFISICLITSHDRYPLAHALLGKRGKAYLPKNPYTCKLKYYNNNFKKLNCKHRPSKYCITSTIFGFAVELCTKQIRYMKLLNTSY